MGICANCKKDIIPGKFIVFSGGALLRDEDDPTTAMPHERLQAFLELVCHDDDEIDEVYKSRWIYDELNEEADCHGELGQFEWYFCCKQCCLNWFKNHLDQIPDIRR